jgi:hypothetical protein
MRRIIQNGDGEAQGSCGANLPAVSRSAAGEPVIIQFPFQASAAALLALEEASSLDTFESLGELAVKLVATWKLPRIRVEKIPL